MSAAPQGRGDNKTGQGVGGTGILPVGRQGEDTGWKPVPPQSTSAGGLGEGANAAFMTASIAGILV